MHRRLEDCHEELRLERDSSLVVIAETIAVFGVALVCCNNLGGREVCRMGGLDARIIGGDESSFGEDCVLCSRNNLGEMASHVVCLCRALAFNSRWSEPTHARLTDACQTTA
jgi:hypothetical protein